MKKEHRAYLLGAQSHRHVEDHAKLLRANLMVFPEKVGRGAGVRHLNSTCAQSSSVLEAELLFL